MSILQAHICYMHRVRQPLVQKGYWLLKGVSLAQAQSASSAHQRSKSCFAYCADSPRFHINDGQEILTDCALGNASHHPPELRCFLGLKSTPAVLIGMFYVPQMIRCRRLGCIYARIAQRLSHQGSRACNFSAGPNGMIEYQPKLAIV